MDAADAEATGKAPGPHLVCDDDLAEEFVPVSAFPLQTEEGRRAFLHQFYWIGETSLFEAVAHVWDSLAEPKDARCTGMGIAAGTGGIGKKALVNVLQKFFGAAMAVDHPLPSPSGFNSSDEWHKASIACLQKDEAAVHELLVSYSIVLNGGSEGGAAVQPGEVIVGPWRAPSPAKGPHGRC